MQTKIPSFYSDNLTSTEAKILSYLPTPVNLINPEFVKNMRLCGFATIKGDNLCITDKGIKAISKTLDFYSRY
jgi:hypothetical protein